MLVLFIKGNPKYTFFDRIVQKFYEIGRPKDDISSIGSKSQKKGPKHKVKDEYEDDDDEDDIDEIDTSVFEEDDDDTGKLERLRSSRIGSKGLPLNVMKSGIKNSSDRNRQSSAVVKIVPKDKIFSAKSKTLPDKSRNIGNLDAIDTEKQSSSSDVAETSEPSLGRRRPSRLVKSLQRKKQQRETGGK